MPAFGTTTVAKVAYWVGYATQAISDLPLDLQVTLEAGSPANAIEFESIDGAVDIGGVDIGPIVSAAAAYSMLIEPESIDGDPSLFGPDIFTLGALALVTTDLTVELHAAGGALIATLPSAYNVTFQAALSEVGRGSCTIPANDPVVANFTIGTEVWCIVHGFHVFTFAVETQPTIVLLAPEEEIGQTYVAEGRGTGRSLAGARVYPEKGIDDPLLNQQRVFSFASREFPNGGSWPYATQISLQSYLDPVRHDFIDHEVIGVDGAPTRTERTETTAPIDWPVPTAWWIWGQPDTTPLGFNYFRKLLTLSQRTVVDFAVSADNYYTFWIDGNPVLKDAGSEGFTWKQFRPLRLTLPAGNYMLAANVENIDNGLSNPAAFLFAAYTTDDDGNVTSTLALSDGSWNSLAYPSSVPGWTPGQAIIKVMEEAQARGALAGWTWDFSGTTDSHGNPWVAQDGSGPYMPLFSVAVGATVLEMLDELVAEGWIDWRVSPAGHVLQVFNHGAVTLPLSTLQATGVLTTQNLARLEATPSDPPETALLTKWSYGLFHLYDPTATAAYGRTEGYAAIDAPNLGEALRQAHVVLDDTASATYSFSATVVPRTEQDWPFVSFGIGDYVTCPNELATPVSMRVWSISVTQTNMGRPVFTVELNRRIKPPVVKNNELLSTLGRGIASSSKSRSAVLSSTSPVRR